MRACISTDWVKLNPDGMELVGDAERAHSFDQKTQEHKYSRSTYDAHCKAHFLLGARHEAVTCLMIRREGQRRDQRSLIQIQAIKMLQGHKGGALNPAWAKGYYVIKDNYRAGI